MEITWRVISGARRGENRGKGTGNKKHEWQVQNRQGEVKIVWEMEKPKNVKIRPMDMNYRGGMWEGAVGRMELSEGAEMGQL